MGKSGILDGKQEIMDFLNCSEHKLLKYAKMGMPVCTEDGRWLAHRNNIEDFFIKYTRKKADLEEIKTPVK